MVRRDAALLLTGAAAAALLARGLAVPADPGLRGCLIVLPAVLSALTILRLRLGAAATPLAARVALGAWVVAALAFDGLGVPAARRPLAVGFVLVLAAVSAPLWPAARRRLVSTRRSDRALLVALPFVLGAAVLPWLHATATPDGDEPYYLLLVESLASDGDLDLADEYADDVASRWGQPGLAPQPGDPVGSRGEAFSRHESLLVPLLVPFWWAGGLLGVRVAMLLAWALLGERTARLATALGIGARGVFRAWLATLLAPPLGLYAYRIWTELPAALALATALDLWLRSRGDGPGLRGRRALGFALALATLALLKWRFLLVAAPLALLPLADRRRDDAGKWSPRWLPAAALAVVGALLLLSNLAGTGRLLRVYDATDLLDLVTAPGQPLLALSGLAFDHAFGLVGSAPLWLLGLAGLGALLARRRELRWVVAATVPYVLLVASLREWFGGWSPPFRYGLVLMPLVTVGLAAWLDRRPTRAGRALGAALGLATALLALVWLAEPGWATSFADGRSRWLDLFAAPFGIDLARFLPSAIRPRTATVAGPLLLIGLVALSIAGRRPGAPRWRAAGAAALLLTLASWLVAAQRVPTNVVELEDPWVAKEGGALYPRRWIPDRTRYRNGWSLRPDDAVRFRPVTGGDSLRIDVVSRGHLVGPPSPVLEALAGDRIIGSFEVEQSARWRTHRLEVARWPRDTELELRLHSASGAPARGGVILDRIRLDWR